MVRLEIRSLPVLRVTETSKPRPNLASTAPMVRRNIIKYGELFVRVDDLRER